MHAGRRTAEHNVKHHTQGMHVANMRRRARQRMQVLGECERTRAVAGSGWYPARRGGDAAAGGGGGGAPVPGGAGGRIPGGPGGGGGPPLKPLAGPPLKPNPAPRADDRAFIWS